MLLVPLIYLKNGKATKPPGTNPPWFREDPVELAKILKNQGASHLYINDLNVPQTGRSENLPAIQAIQKLDVKLWVQGNFRSLTMIETYSGIGVDKIVVGAFAYQTPDLFKEACQKFSKKIAAMIEVKNKHVAITGMVTPSHKTALDYSNRFEEEGVACICYSDSNAQGALEEESFQNIKEFCTHVKVPVLCINDIRSTDDLEKLFAFQTAGLMGAVLGKSLYENRIDLHGAMAFLDDLTVAVAREPTLM